MTQVDAILARLLALHPRRIDLSLEPHVAHPRTRSAIRNAVCRRSFMSPAPTAKARRSRSCAPVLEAAGKRAHVYTSPNLVRINERFRLAGTLVADEELGRRAGRNASAPTAAHRSPCSRLKPQRRSCCSPGIPPMCCCWKSVLAGGWMRPTSSRQPLASVITPVSIDHVDLLGDTLEKSRPKKPPSCGAACRR